MTTITQNWLNENANVDQHYMSHLVNYTDSATGAKTCMETLQKSIQLIGEIRPMEGLRRWDSMLGTGISAFTLTFLPGATQDAVHSLGAVNQEEGRTVWNAIRDTSDAIISYCSCATLFSQNPLIGRVSQIAEGIYDSTDLHLSYSDYYKAAEMEEHATGEVKKVFSHSKDYYWLRIARAVVSIAAMILGLFLVISGVQWISGIALIALSLASSLFAILRDTHKNSGKYSVIGFDHRVQVMV